MPSEGQSNIHIHHCQSLKRRRRSTLPKIEERPWTAQRCQRMLRQITTTLNTLHRCQHGDECLPVQPTLETPQRRRSVVNTGSALFGVGATPSSANKDPDWVPKQTKAITATGRRYSRFSKYRDDAIRAKRHGADIAHAEERSMLSLATPRLKKIINGVAASSPLSSRDHLDDNIRSSRPFVGGDELNKNLSLLNDVVSRLLRETADIATEVNDNTRHRGASLLLSMCARKVPSLIVLEELEQDSSLPEDRRDVASEIYSELEDLGLGRGWLPLRDVVRAHGLELVSQAVRENIVPTERLNVICRQARGFEARQILGLVIEATQYANMSSSSQCGLMPYHHNSKYTQLISLVLSTQLAVSSTATATMRGLWTAIAKRLTEPSQRRFEVAFELVQASLQHILSASEKNPQPSSNIALARTLASVVRTVGIILVGAGDTFESAGLQHNIWTMKCLALDIMLSSRKGGDYQGVVSNGVALHLSAILVTALLVLQLGRRLEELSLLSFSSIMNFLARLDHPKQDATMLHSIAVSSAKCTGKSLVLFIDGFVSVLETSTPRVLPYLTQFYLNSLISHLRLLQSRGSNSDVKQINESTLVSRRVSGGPAKPGIPMRPDVPNEAWNGGADIDELVCVTPIFRRTHAHEMLDYSSPAEHNDLNEKALSNIGCSLPYTRHTTDDDLPSGFEDEDDGPKDCIFSTKARHNDDVSNTNTSGDIPLTTPRHDTPAVTITIPQLPFSPDTILEPQNISQRDMTVPIAKRRQTLPHSHPSVEIERYPQHEALTSRKELRMASRRKTRKLLEDVRRSMLDQC